jgi:hypothetical protein
VTAHERPVGATVEWYTPPGLFDAIGLTFDLDPASPGSDVVPWLPAHEHYTRDDDGLRQNWYGLVWLNPPYGPAAVPFVDAMIEHGDGMLLLPARTETRNFQWAASNADSVCFLRDRLHFIRNDGFQARSSFGSTLFAFGARSVTALGNAELGWLVENFIPASSWRVA